MNFSFDFSGEIPRTGSKNAEGLCTCNLRTVRCLLCHFELPMPVPEGYSCLVVVAGGGGFFNPSQLARSCVTKSFEWCEVVSHARLMLYSLTVSESEHGMGSFATYISIRCSNSLLHLERELGG